MAYPTSTTTFATASGLEVLNSLGSGVGLAGMLNVLGVDVTAVETKIGTGSSTPTSNTVLAGNGTGTSAWTTTLAGLILTTPTIASFTNAQHTHANAAGGGQLGTTALSDSAVTTAKIANNAVTAAKLVNGQVYRHQGGSATVLDTVGTTTFDLSATDVKIQTGRATGAGSNSDTSITFPVAFTNTPLIVASPYSSGGNYPTWYLVAQTNSGFTFRTGVNVATFSWMAIGI